MKSIGFQTGPKYLDDLERFDVIIKSPGVPPQPEFAAVKSKLTSSTQIFFDSIADTGALVIGVTGSKGKSTTSSLIFAILKAAGKKAFLVGNIGEPAIAHVADADRDTVFVQEMSSYQLMDLRSSPAVAVITAFFPEHLDYHGSLASYLEAKKHITRFQTKDDVVFFNAQSPESAEIAAEGHGAKMPFTWQDSPVSLDEIHLKGDHNLGNIAAAYRVVIHLGIDPATAANAIRGFDGLPHRLQSLGVIDGIEWVNDSISTTPQSAIAALDALGESVETIILGGQDRGYDFAPLVKRLAASNVKNVILMPESGPTVGAMIRKMKLSVNCVIADTMSKAVAGAKKAAEAGTIVLLSPASPSYGHFKNFEDRGEQFEKNIRGETWDGKDIPCDC